MLNCQPFIIIVTIDEREKTCEKPFNIVKYTVCGFQYISVPSNYLVNTDCIGNSKQYHHFPNQTTYLD